MYHCSVLGIHHFPGGKCQVMIIDYLKMSTSFQILLFQERKLWNKELLIGAVLSQSLTFEQKPVFIAWKVNLLFSLTDALRDECKWDSPVSQPRCGIRSRVTGKFFNLWTVWSFEASTYCHWEKGPKHGEEEGTYCKCSSLGWVLIMNMQV